MNFAIRDNFKGKEFADPGQTCIVLNYEAVYV